MKDDIYSLVKHETGLSHSRSPDADLPRPDALWVLHTGEVCGYGRIRTNGISVLQSP